MKQLFKYILLLTIFGACRPPSNNTALFNASMNQVTINVVVQNNRITLLPPTGRKITAIKAISPSKDRVGTFTAGRHKNYVSLFSDFDKPVYDIELIMDSNVSCRTDPNGVALIDGSSFNVGCDSQTDLESPKSLQTVIVGRLLDIERSKISKTPCTVFPLNGRVVTAGHCMLTPETASNVTIELGARTAKVSKLVGHELTNARDFAVFETVPKLEGSFRIGEFRSITNVLYVAGYPMDGRAEPVSNSDQDKHSHFVNGTSRLLFAKCQSFQEESDDTFSATCAKMGQHQGSWAGFSGAPILNPETSEVFGIMNSTSSNSQTNSGEMTVFFSKISVVH